MVLESGVLTWAGAAGALDHLSPQKTALLATSAQIKNVALLTPQLALDVACRGAERLGEEPAARDRPRPLMGEVLNR